MERDYDSKGKEGFDSHQEHEEAGKAEGDTAPDEHGDDFYSDIGLGKEDSPGNFDDIRREGETEKTPAGSNEE